MSKAIDIERARVERLAEEIVPLLQQQGYAIQSLEAVEDVDRWRRAARRAARILGWRIATGIGDDRVWCLSQDFPDPDDGVGVADFIDRLYKRDDSTARYEDALERQLRERSMRSKGERRSGADPPSITPPEE